MHRDFDALHLNPDAFILSNGAVERSGVGAVHSFVAFILYAVAMYNHSATLCW
jgi:hypothetical protein